VDVVQEGECVTRLALGAAYRVQPGREFLADLEGAIGRGRTQFLFRAQSGNGREKRA
jgi:hypothetical protein